MVNIPEGAQYINRTNGIFYKDDSGVIMFFLHAGLWRSSSIQSIRLSDYGFFEEVIYD